jgi:hypothetical protein
VNNISEATMTKTGSANGSFFGNLIYHY